MAKTRATSVRTVRPHVRLVQMINPTSAQATRTCMTTKLPNKQYEIHTTIKLHGETIPMTILAELLQDLASPSAKISCPKRKLYKTVRYTISCLSTYEQDGTSFPDQFQPHSPPRLLPLSTHANNGLVALPKSRNFGADIFNTPLKSSPCLWG